MSPRRGVASAIAGALAGLLILSVMLDIRLAALEATVTEQSASIAKIIDALKRHGLAQLD